MSQMNPVMGKTEGFLKALEALDVLQSQCTIIGKSLLESQRIIYRLESENRELRIALNAVESRDRSREERR